MDHLNRTNSDIISMSMPVTATNGRMTAEQMREASVFSSGARAMLEDLFSNYFGGVP